MTDIPCDIHDAILIVLAPEPEIATDAALEKTSNKGTRKKVSFQERTFTWNLSILTGIHHNWVHHSVDLKLDRHTPCKKRPLDA